MSFLRCSSWRCSLNLHVVLVLLFLLHSAVRASSGDEVESATTADQEEPTTTVDMDEPTTTPATTERRRPLRLPNTTHPVHYDLNITTRIHAEDFAFQGNVSIELVVDEDTAELVLHAVDLKVIDVQVEDLTLGERVPKVDHELVDELLVVTRHDGLAFERTHRLRLAIDYAGTINDTSLGFSQLSYQNADNNTVYYAYTQMEPIFARTVLPCYDEPGRKATFAVTITHGSNYSALSNMRAIDTVAHRDDDEMATTRFLTTPMMSTYLLAFVVSDFEHVAVEADGIVQRFFIPPTFVDRVVRSPLAFSVNATAAFGRLFGIPYPLSKLDHVVVLESYGLAMENWGLITYSDSALRTATTTPAEILIAQLNSIYTYHHELAHQWFGNLVSPAWWDVIWLNEGFATYYGLLLTDMMFPEFDTLEYFETHYCNLDLGFQINITIYEYVEKPKDIMGMFNMGAYRKAPCVLKMFDRAFPPTVFLDGVSRYLKAFAYSVADEDDLFDHLQAAMVANADGSNWTWDKSVAEILRTWTRNKGEPLATVTRDYVANTVRIEQTPAAKNCTDLWWIPITFATKSDPDFDNTTADFYMPPVPVVELELADLGIALGPDDWLILNVQANGFYTVRYDDENLRRIVLALRTDHTAIHKKNRGLVLQSLWDHRNSLEGFEVLRWLQMLGYLTDEREPYVWASLRKQLMALVSELMEVLQLEEPFNDYVRSVVGPPYTRFAASPATNLTRGETTMVERLEETACLVGLPECVQKYRDLVVADMAGRRSEEDEPKLDKGMCHVFRTASDEEFDKMFAFYNKTESMQRVRCFRTQAQIERLLNATAELPASHEERLDRFHFWTKALFARKMLDSNYGWEFMEQQLASFASDTELAKYTEILCTKIKARASELVYYKPEKLARVLTSCKEKLLPDDFDDTLPTEDQADSDSKHVLVKKIAAKMNGKWKDDISAWLQQSNEVFAEKINRR